MTSAGDAGCSSGSAGMGSNPSYRSSNNNGQAEEDPVVQPLSCRNNGSSVSN